ncbi:MAG TPA: SIMPL domain-containing protein [Streptosporangiaceae bacterium]
MNDADGVVLSVRAESRQLVAPDYALLDGVIEHTAKADQAQVVRMVADSLDRLTADLATRGAVPFDEGAGHRPLTWSVHSWASHEERHRDKQTGLTEHSGVLTASVALRIMVRDLSMLDDLGGMLAAHPDLRLHGVAWHVDWDNPTWPQVRAAAIHEAIGKAQDYAAAIGATLRLVEHIADTGLLGGDTMYSRAGRNPASAVATGMGGGMERPGTPALTPVPQELIASVEARFRTTAVTLPGSGG